MQLCNKFSTKVSGIRIWRIRRIHPRNLVHPKMIVRPCPLDSCAKRWGKKQNCWTCSGFSEEFPWPFRLQSTFKFLDVPQDLMQQSYLHLTSWHCCTAAHPKLSLVRQRIWGKFYSSTGTMLQQPTHTVLVQTYWRHSVFVSTSCIHKISQDSVSGVPYQFEPKNKWRRLRPTLKLEARWI